MARPRKDGEVAQNRGFRMLDQDWEALGNKAKALGFRGRAELMAAIARGQVTYVSANPELDSDQNQRLLLLGESVPG